MNAGVSKPRVVVIGSGAAGIACVEEILLRGRDAFTLTVIGDHDGAEHEPEWYRQHGVDVHAGVRVARIERTRRLVLAEGGGELAYDKLVLATGAAAHALPVPGRHLAGAFALRSLAECPERLATGRERRAAVVGGGVLGIEVARTLRQRGLQTTLVHLPDRLMERELDRTGADYVLAALRRQGIDVWLGAQTQAILGSAQVSGLRFADGGELAADLVVMATGTLPRIELARAAGLACRRGVIVDDHLRTSDPDVYALGACAEHRRVCYGPGPALHEQGRALAAHLFGAPTPYPGSLVVTRSSASGIDVFSAGRLDDAPGLDVMRIEDSTRGVYKKAVIQDGRIVGAVLVGDLAPAAALEHAVRTRAPATLELLSGGAEAARVAA